MANGVIEGCYDGVVIAGDGHHEIRRTEARDLGGGTAYDVQGDGNLIADSVVKVCDECVAFSVRGDGNRLRGNTATTSLGTDPLRDIAYGVNVYGDRNILWSNEVRVVEYGMRIEGDRNRLRRNTIDGHHGGVWVIGNRNRVTRTSAVTGGSIALALHGERNVATRNYAVRGNEGCAVSLAGERSRLRRTGVHAELSFCVAGARHRVENNVALSSETLAFRVRGTGHLLRRNVSQGGGSGHTGFWIVGQLHTLIGNLASEHRGSGFHVDEGAVGNLLKGNAALRNNLDETSEHFDLRDDNPGCGTNRWARSEFGTRSQACIEGDTE